MKGTVKGFKMTNLIDYIEQLKLQMGSKSVGEKIA